MTESDPEQSLIAPGLADASAPLICIKLPFADCDIRCYNLSVAERPSLIEEFTHMNRKSFLVGLLAAGCFVATSTLMTSPGSAQADPKVAKAMAILKAETAKLGAPKVEGTDQTADKTTPGLY